MTRDTTHKLLEHLLCGVPAGVFLIAGANKIGDPQAFADSIAGFQLLPVPWMITMLALGLPFFEMLVAVTLFVPSWRRAGLLAVMAMSVVFIIALTSAWSRGIVADCGCFGKGQVSAWSLPIAIIRNLVMLVISIGIYCRVLRVWLKIDQVEKK